MIIIVIFIIIYRVFSGGKEKTAMTTMSKLIEIHFRLLGGFAID